MKNYDFSNNSQNTYKVEARHNFLSTCPECKEGTEFVILDGTQYYNYYMNGYHIQVAFPNLTPEQRELLITGLHPECSDKFWARLDDES